MLNDVREIQALQSGDPGALNNLNLSGLGSALARLQGNQPASGCSTGCCGGNCDTSPDGLLQGAPGPRAVGRGDLGAARLIKYTLE